jgi:hypothetical protein
MRSYLLVLIVDPPGSVEELPHLYPCLGIGCSIGAGRDVNGNASKSDGIVVPYRGFVAKANDPVNVEAPGHRTPGFLGF